MIRRCTDRCLDMRCIGDTASCDAVVENFHDRVDCLQAREPQNPAACPSWKASDPSSAVDMILYQSLNTWESGRRVPKAGKWGVLLCKSMRRWGASSSTAQKQREGGAKGGREEGSKMLHLSFLRSFVLSALADRVVSSRLSQGRSFLFTYEFKYQPLP